MGKIWDEKPFIVELTKDLLVVCGCKPSNKNAIKTLKYMDKWCND
jgi:hypothetical protein